MKKQVKEKLGILKPQSKLHRKAFVPSSSTGQLVERPHYERSPPEIYILSQDTDGHKRTQPALLPAALWRWAGCSQDSTWSPPRAEGQRQPTDKRPIRPAAPLSLPPTLPTLSLASPGRRRPSARCTRPGCLPAGPAPAARRTAAGRPAARTWRPRTAATRPDSAAAAARRQHGANPASPAAARGWGGATPRWPPGPPSRSPRRLVGPRRRPPTGGDPSRRRPLSVGGVPAAQPPPRPAVLKSAARRHC